MHHEKRIGVFGWSLVSWMGVLCLALLMVAAGVAAQPVELTYMSWYGGTSAEIEQEVIDAFNAKNPDIRVTKLEGDPRQKLVTMVAAGAPPDVSIVNGVTQAHILTDVALDITAAVERTGISLDAYIPGLVENVITRDGRIYGLPWGFGFFNLMINETRFNEVGLAVPAPDWSLAEMTESAAKLTRDADSDGTADQIGLWPGFMSPEEPLFMMHGAQIVDPVTGTTDVHTPAYYDAVQYVSDIINVQQVASRSTFGMNRRQAFIDGRFGMVGEWQSAIPEFVRLNAHETSDWSMAYWPAGRGPQTTLGWGHSVSVIQGTEHPEEATRFVLFWASEEAEAILSKAGLYPQTLAGLRAMASELDLPPGYTPERVMGPLLNLPQRVVIPPFHYPGYVEVSNDVVRPVLLEVVEGNRPARQAFESIRDQVERVLAEANRR